ncbi:hypothetical protein [Ottowia testudinis]|uniref:Uncharacterized protein n=1 Tax=Ottowia testudinis TaxID=2816950 RepID=A0A975CCF4_9BURK|nr:hypothetical protein [Ottowia testudinis]QTD43720.1 hypothetical protein J1M35_11160 [Ottowia testudinis]
MVEVTGKTFGLFHAIAHPIYSWGVARKVTFPGVNIDVGYQRRIAAAKDNDESIWIAYNRMRGQYASALEHAVPERFFNDPAKCNSYDNPSPTAGLPACPQAISAVKALSLAATQGQKIYTITKEVYQRNPNIVSTQLSAHSEQARSRIQNALNQGLEVTIHERLITESGWKGSGYILIDPSTGAGAYEIEGGSQGASLISKILDFLFVPLLSWGVILGNINHLLDDLKHLDGFFKWLGAATVIIDVILTALQIVGQCKDSAAAAFLILGFTALIITLTVVFAGISPLLAWAIAPFISIAKNAVQDYYLNMYCPKTS